MIDLSYADLKYSPPPELLENLKRELGRINLYPSGVYSELREAFAGYAGVDKANVLAGNGGDEIIDLITRVWGKRVLIPTPTYSQYSIAAKRRDAKRVLVNCFDHEQYNIAFTKNHLERASLIWICNPNNPTGNKITRERIISILKKARGMVAIDECYYEFSGESVVDLLSEFDNLIIVRSLSKNFGLAGLRLGFAISAPRNIEELEKVRQIFSVNRLAERAGIEVFNHLGYYKQLWNKISETRKIFSEEVRMLGLLPFESHTNFVLVKLNNMAQMESIWRGLRERHINVLRADNEEEFTGLNGPFLRFTIGTDDEMRVVTHVMGELIQSGIYRR